MSELDGRVMAIAGAAGGLGPSVATRLAAERGDDRRRRSLRGAPGPCGPSSSFPMIASTAGWSTCSTSRRRASGRSTCASDSAAWTRCCTWWAAGAAASRSPRRRCPTTSGSTTCWSAPSSTRRAPSHDALAASDHGRFVLVSSSQAQSPTATNASYAAAKAAAESWTLALADSLQGLRGDREHHRRQRDPHPAHARARTRTRSSEPSPPPSRSPRRSPSSAATRPRR